MNCPGHCLLYSQTTHSYRELPLRLRRGREPSSERALGRAARAPSRPALRAGRRPHLLLATSRCTTRSSAASTTPSSSTTCSASTPRCELSTRPENRLGTDEEWDRAEAALDTRARARSWRRGTSARARARSTGPKIDLHMTDSLGRSGSSAPSSSTTRCRSASASPTSGADNREHTPGADPPGPARLVRALPRRLPRAHGGDFPVWLAPVQARVVPVADRHRDAAAALRASWRRAAFAPTSTPARRRSRSASGRPSSRRSPTSSSSATRRPRATPSRYASAASRTSPSRSGRRPSTRSRKLLPCEACKQERRVPHLRGPWPGGGSTENR